ncbi:MAG: heme-binding protein [Arhodomonas sp.]|nr:heme-binding protein [Arhodomonas sp.]
MQKTVTQHGIHWEAAHAAVRGAVAKAEALGIRINVAVCDAAGTPMAFLRMPGRRCTASPSRRTRPTPPPASACPPRSGIRW